MSLKSRRYDWGKKKRKRKRSRREEGDRKEKESKMNIIQIGKSIKRKK